MNTTTLTLEKEKTKHKVEIKKDSRGNVGSAFNTWVKIYVKGEKYPYVATLMTDSTPLSELIGWAEIQIANYPMNTQTL